MNSGALEVVNLFIRKEFSIADIGLLIEDIIFVEKSMNIVHSCHIPRENKFAHALAILASSWSCSLIWKDVSPSSILSLSHDEKVRALG